MLIQNYYCDRVVYLIEDQLTTLKKQSIVVDRHIWSLI